jgi:hypothetical protein
MDQESRSKPIHSQEELDELIERHSKQELHARQFFGGDITIGEIEGARGILRTEEDQPMRVLHVAGDLETVIAEIKGRQIDYVAVPIGWTPSAPLAHLHFRQLALRTWVAYLREGTSES